MMISSVSTKFSWMYFNTVRFFFFFVCGFSISLVATENDILVKKYFSYTSFSYCIEIQVFVCCFRYVDLIVNT